MYSVGLLPLRKKELLDFLGNLQELGIHLTCAWVII